MEPVKVKPKKVSPSPRRELLRIAMNAEQIRIACMVFAQSKSIFDKESADLSVEGVPSDMRISVIFTDKPKKRARKARAQGSLLP